MMKTLWSCVLFFVLVTSVANSFNITKVANMSDPTDFNKTIVDISSLRQAAQELGKEPRARNLMSVIIDDSRDKGFIVFKTKQSCYEIEVKNITSEGPRVELAINKTYHVDEHQSSESDEEEEEEPLEIAFWLNLSKNLPRRKLEVDTLCKLIHSVKVVDKERRKTGVVSRVTRATRCVYVRVNKKRICKLVIIPG
jgi:hypothetical protein